MRNRVIAGLVFTVAAMLPGTSFAEIKIGYFNLVQVIEEAPQAAAALKKLEEEFAPREQEVRSLADKIKAAEQEMEKNALVWKESERREKEKSLRNQTRELKRISEEIREDINIRRNEELSEIQKAVYDVVQQVARDGEFDLIIHEGVVYASPAINITGLVLERLSTQ